jgi:hypothetical protein
MDHIKHKSQQMDLMTTVHAGMVRDDMSISDPIVEVPGTSGDLNL